MEMRNKKTKLKKLNALLIAISVIFTISLLMFGKQLKERCFFGADCSWVITNCCPEELGAKWECVNIKSYHAIECPERILCYPIPSPKPLFSCVCQQGSCVVK
jgi:hypothetical protein